MKIVSLVFNRLDFIPLQLESAKKHIKEDFEYIILDNSLGKLSMTIKDICVKIGATYIQIPTEQDSYTVSFAYNYYWRNFGTSELTIMAEADMFFIHDISFEKEMEDYNLMYVPHSQDGIEWIWSNFVVMQGLDLKEMDWGFKAIGGVHCDIGSATSEYLEKYKPEVKHLTRKTFGKYAFDYLLLNNKRIVFHYKCSSNYAVHCTDEYNGLKTKAMLKLLK